MAERIWPVLMREGCFKFITHWQAQQTSDLQLGRAEMLRGLRNILNMDRPDNHSIDRLKEGELEKETVDVSPTEVGTDLCSTRLKKKEKKNSRATLGRLL